MRQAAGDGHGGDKDGDHDGDDDDNDHHNYHLPVRRQLRQAEGDGHGGDEDAVEHGKHCQQLPETYLDIIDMIETTNLEMV